MKEGSPSVKATDPSVKSKITIKQYRPSLYIAQGYPSNMGEITTMQGYLVPKELEIKENE